MVSHQRFWIMVREMLDFIDLFELGPFTLCLLCVIQGLWFTPKGGPCLSEVLRHLYIYIYIYIRKRLILTQLLLY